MPNADGVEVAQFLQERLPLHLEKLLIDETVKLLKKVGPPKPPGKQAKKKGQAEKVMDETRGTDHVYHLGVWKGQSETHFHPTSESYCAHTRAYIENITPVLDFLAGAYKRACPTRHRRCVAAARYHRLPRTMPGPFRFCRAFVCVCFLLCSKKCRCSSCVRRALRRFPQGTRTR